MIRTMVIAINVDIIIVDNRVNILVLYVMAELMIAFIC